MYELETCLSVKQTHFKRSSLTSNQTPLFTQYTQACVLIFQRPIEIPSWQCYWKTQ